LPRRSGRDDNFLQAESAAGRLINQSAESSNELNSDPQQALLNSGIGLIPNDLGIRMDVAAFGTQVSYICVSPKPHPRRFEPRNDCSPIERTHL
jgi:hypothetical protein